MSLVARVISNHRPPSPTQSTCICIIQKYIYGLYVLPFFSSLVLFNLDHFRSYPCRGYYFEIRILGHALSRGGQDISLKVYRVFFVNETEEQSEKFRRNKSSYGAIYLQTFPIPPFPPFFLLFCPPSSFSLFLLEHFPILSLSLSLSVSAAANSGFHSFFFFFVSFCRHRLSVTHCPSAATMCSVLQNCTRYVKRKNFGVQTRNTLVLKRVFPRFRSYPLVSYPTYSGRALLFPA